MKKIPLDDLQERARILTRKELKKHRDVKGLEWDRIFLTVYFDGDNRIFSLYQLRNRENEPSSLISEATLNVFTGKGNVEVFLPEIKEDNS